jgi:outer membrane protein W
MIDIDATLKTRTFDPAGTEAVFTSTLDTEIDPFIFSAQLGFRF